MLESGEALQAWALEELPAGWQSLATVASSLQFAATNTCAVERLADHRLAYLDFEGPLTGDRGTVRRVDVGIYSAGKNPYALEFVGQTIRGKVELKQATAGAWQLTFTPVPA